MATRVLDKSSSAAVSGSLRFKYFKRPIMPRVSAVPPHILLAPTVATGPQNNPLEPVEAPMEPATKDMEVQTMYRESEAQTAPYAPDYTVQPGQDPEVLLLKNLTYEDGLPLGKKEIDMIEYARAKRELESKLPPFTDEASLILRKRLMEQQEMKEYKLRENEIDEKRENKLKELDNALRDREESNEFMNSQKIEGIRLMRMEEREKVLAKIKQKRIKALRRLAQQRNKSDPVLSEGVHRDIINDYFDRGSKSYAPIKRDGNTALESESDKFDIAPRTLPLDNIGNIISLEYTIPQRLMDSGDPSVTMMSKTAPAGAAINLRAAGAGGGGGKGATMGGKMSNSAIGVSGVNKSSGGRASEPRMTSAAQRALRMTKRDVEEMHHILMSKKREGMPSAVSAMSGAGGGGAVGAVPGTAGTGMGSSRPITGATTRTAETAGSTRDLRSELLAKRPKGRPPTPDITKIRARGVLPENPISTSAQRDGSGESKENEEAAGGDGQQPGSSATRRTLLQQQQHQQQQEEEHAQELARKLELRDNLEFQSSIVLLQRLIRGRAVQNIMFEGRYRRRELIDELKAADEAARLEARERDPMELNIENKEKRMEELTSTTVDAVAGSTVSQMLHFAACEKERIDLCDELMHQAQKAIEQRRDLEAAETGRRQREGFLYPTKKR